MKRVLTAIAAVLIVSSCATIEDGFRSTTVFDHTGRRRDVEPSVRVVLKEQRTRFELTSPYTPGITISGIVEQRGDSYTLYVSRARLFTNWANGWTEAFYEASGVLSVVPAEGRRWRLVVDDPVDLWSITDGEIRYFDTYVQGDEGLTKVKARIDRLAALAEWMHAVADRPVFGHPQEAGTYGAAMTTALWNYVDNALADADADRTGELDAGAFADKVIDPPLWLPELYESGTIERDVREAAGLLVALHNLDTLNQTIFDSILLEDF